MPPRVDSSAVGAGPARSAIISRNSERRSKTCITGPLRSPCCELARRVRADFTRPFENIQARRIFFDARVATTPERENIFIRPRRAAADALDSGGAGRLASARIHHGLRIRRRARGL